MHCAAQKRNIEWNLITPLCGLYQILRSFPDIAFSHERVDAWTFSMLMIAARCYTISYKKTFFDCECKYLFSRDRLRQQLARASEKGWKQSSRVACAERFLEKESSVWKRHVPRMDPPAPRAEMVSLAGNTKFDETMLAKSWKCKTSGRDAVLPRQTKEFDWLERILSFGNFFYWSRLVLIELTS